MSERLRDVDCIGESNVQGRQTYRMYLQNVINRSICWNSTSFLSFLPILFLSSFFLHSFPLLSSPLMWSTPPSSIPSANGTEKTKWIKNSCENRTTKNIKPVYCLTEMTIDRNTPLHCVNVLSSRHCTLSFSYPSPCPCHCCAVPAPFTNALTFFPWVPIDLTQPLTHPLSLPLPPSPPALAPAAPCEWMR